MAASGTPEQVAAIALLSEPARRALYGYVAAQGREVGRDEAANAVGVSRALAAFHLDKLADGSSTSRTGGSGDEDGRGRPAKLYRRSGATLEVRSRRGVSTLVRMLASPSSAWREGGASPQDALRPGGGIGAEARDRTRRRPRGEDRGGPPTAGSNPHGGGRRDRARNCPFDGVAWSSPTSRGANVAFTGGSGDRGRGSGRPRAGGGPLLRRLPRGERRRGSGSRVRLSHRGRISPRTPPRCSGPPPAR
jgi:hypothetical protein